MIRVVAVITANPGRRDELLPAFRANVPNVHAEKGASNTPVISTPRPSALSRRVTDRTLLSFSNPGEPRGAEGGRRGPSHEDLLGKDQGPCGETDDPHPVRDRLGRPDPGSE
jgi:hypothetical protein